RAGKMDFENLLFEDGRDYSPMRSYGRSKLSNLLFTYELQRFFETNDVQNIAVAAHPGGSRTNLDQHINKNWWFKILQPLAYSLSQSAAMGALPQIRASVDPSVKGAEYYGPRNAIGEMTGYPQLVESNAASHNEEDAKKLWEVSEKLTGVSFLVI
ncbi:MAG: short-chain dehydrogenase, partial [Bacteroidales bacterium]|nr:short-chain dehydrogenase [Bacteroidales bacterium]